MPVKQLCISSRHVLYKRIHQDFHSSHAMDVWTVSILIPSRRYTCGSLYDSQYSLHEQRIPSTRYTTWTWLHIHIPPMTLWTNSVLFLAKDIQNIHNHIFLLWNTCTKLTLFLAKDIQNIHNHKYMFLLWIRVLKQIHNKHNIYKTYIMTYTCSS